MIGADLSTNSLNHSSWRAVLRIALGTWLAALLSMSALHTAVAAEVPSPHAADDSAAKAPLLQLGPGDSVNIQVYGQPDLSTTVYVGDDGTLSIPLAGNVQVAGMSPAQASGRI